MEKKKREIIKENMQEKDCQKEINSFLEKLNEEDNRTLEKIVKLNLEEIEERYEKLLEIMPDAVVIHSEGKVLYVNKAAANLFGEESAEDMIGTDIMHYVHPVYHEFVKERIKSQSEGNSVPLAEEKFIDKQGNILEVEVISSPVKYNGKPAFQVVFRDISHKKETEKALKESKELYTNLFKHSMDGIYISTLKGKFIDFNEALCLMLGYNREELQNIDIANIYYDPKERENFKKILLEKQFVSKYEMELKKKDGSKIMAELSSQVLKNYKGEIIGFQGIIRDITNYKKAEEDLRKSEEKYRSILNAIPDIIFHLDKHGTFLSYKTQKEEELLLPPEQFLGKKAQDILPPFLAELTITNIKKALKTGEVQTYEYELDIGGEKKKHMYFEARVSPCGKNEVVAIIRNNTDKKIAEEEKNRLYEERYIQATRDALTNFYNEYEFDRILRYYYNECLTKGEEYGLMIIELDRFEAIDRIYGKTLADKIISVIGKKIKEVFDNQKCEAEFGRMRSQYNIIIKNCEKEKTEFLFDRIKKAISDLGDEEEKSMRLIKLTCSVGCSKMTNKVKSAGEAYKIADFAKKKAKERGGNRMVYMTEENSEVKEYLSSFRWVEIIKNALIKDDFELYCQPIINLNMKGIKRGEILMKEALLRLKHKNRIVSPMKFIPAAIEYGVMNEIDRWVLDNIFSQSAKNGKVTYSINISPLSINDPDFLDYVRELKSKYSTTPEKICFEITENVAVSNLEQAIYITDKFVHWGFLTAIDDFGSGEFKIEHLEKLPIQIVKIYGKYVRGIGQNNKKRKIVKAINDLAKSFGKLTIAEHVTNEKALEILEDMGVDCAQGYVIGRPKKI